MDTDVICMLAMLSAVLAPSAALPVKYDQRQDGELNVHAHLENFVIVLIPNNGGLGLLDFIPLKKDVNRHGGAKPASSGSDSEKYVPPSTVIKSSSPDFPAGKSPYKVDIGKKPDSHTSNVGDEKSPASGEEEVVIAHSPPVLLSKAPAKTESESQPTTTSSAGETSVEVTTENTKKEDPIASSEKTDAALAKTDAALAKTDSPADGKDDKKDDVPVVDSVPEKSVKSPKSIDFVVEVPLTGVKKATEEDIPVIDFSSKSVKSSKLPAFRSESADSEELANKLKQLRSGLEECAPGQRRDRLGNCHYTKSRSGQFFAPESLLPALQFGLSPAID